MINQVAYRVKPTAHKGVAARQKVSGTSGCYPPIITLTVAERFSVAKRKASQTSAKG